MHPDRVRVLGPEGWGQIHSVGSKFEKDEEYNKCFGCGGTSVGFIKPEEYRPRRKMLLGMLGKEAALRREGVLQEKVEGLCSVLRGGSQEREDGCVMMRQGLAGVVTDYILQYLAGFDYE